MWQSNLSNILGATKVNSVQPQIQLSTLQGRFPFLKKRSRTFRNQKAYLDFALSAFILVHPKVCNLSLRMANRFMVPVR